MNLLIVEDLPGEAENLRQAAIATGLVTRVQVARDIATAKHMVYEWIPELCVGSKTVAVLLDHDLPEEDGGPETGSGADIAKAILRHDPMVPIVGISAVESNNIHLEHCGAFLSVEKRNAASLMPSLLRACITWRKAMESGRNPSLPIH